MKSTTSKDKSGNVSSVGDKVKDDSPITIAIAIASNETANSTSTDDDVTAKAWVPPPRRRPQSAESDERSLLQYLSDIDPSVRPVKNNKDAVMVEVGLTLIQIIDMNEKDQVLTANVWIDQLWKDQFATWNDSDFNGLQNFRIPCKKLWRPDLVLYNSASDYVEDRLCPRALLTTDGTVFWPLPVKLRSSCKVDVTFFPFDEQRCHLRFGSWIYDGTQVDIKVNKDNVSIETYIPNCEWDLLNTTAFRVVQMYPCCPVPYPEVTFELHIKRRLLYYLYHVVYPCVTMSILTLLQFSLPPESGEKISLGITVLLAFSVLTLAIAEALPETSDSIPLISIYLIVVMTISSLSIMLTVVVLNIHYCSHNTPPLPNHFRRFILKDLADETVLSASGAKKNNSSGSCRLFLKGFNKLPPWKDYRKKRDKAGRSCNSRQKRIINPSTRDSDMQSYAIDAPSKSKVRIDSPDETTDSNGTTGSANSFQALVTSQVNGSGTFRVELARSANCKIAANCDAQNANEQEKKGKKLPTKANKYNCSKDGASFLNSCSSSPVYMSPVQHVYANKAAHCSSSSAQDSCTQADEATEHDAHVRMNMNTTKALKVYDEHLTELCDGTPHPHPHPHPHPDPETSYKSHTFDLLLAHMNRILQKEQVDEETAKRNREWQIFARFIDRVLFWSFVVVTAILTFIALVLVPVLSETRLSH